MFDPHQISARLTVAAGLSLLATLVVPTAFARPFDDGGGALVEPGSNPAAVVDATTSGFDWTAPLVVVLIGLAVLVATLAVRRTAGRRETQLAAR